jgi:ABC-type nitrate/sulfonate/bicarbonate transport system permease component
MIGQAIRKLSVQTALLYPLILVIVAWEASTRAGLVQPAFLPSFSSVVVQGAHLLQSGRLGTALLVSLFRAFSGLALAIVVGVTCGFLMTRLRWLNWLLDPLVSLGFPAPKLAFIPIFILWFGIDHLSKILLVAFADVFPLIISAIAGARTVPPMQIWAARAMGTPELALFWRVILPSSLPSLMSGLQIAVPLALLTEFTAEMVAGGGGLGGDLVLAQRFFEAPTVFVDILAMLISGYVIDTATTRLRRHILRWHDEAHDAMV